ncbi:MAG: hypothetical protein M1828_004779 [Chrysothrix sp. TS-e1954]|nr:MAG: hypothetical protein M1828_004779 [Chrysothrix sp. TS-e1954]
MAQQPQSNGARTNGSAPSVNVDVSDDSLHTPKALERWSCIDKALPDIDSIKHLHVYDFDNTLFCSPLPNRQLWDGPAVGLLQNEGLFVNGGWWHDSNVLRATGQGMEVEEKRGWEGWWNEKIVDLVRLSMQQEDALAVLVTGRSKDGFADVITRMVKSRNLEFDAIVLKPPSPKYPSTLKYKQAFFEELICTYRSAEELRVYEDRIKHVQAFQEYFTSFNASLVAQSESSATGLVSSSTRNQPIKAEVIEVAEKAVSLDPVTEVAQVQRMANDHNAHATATAPSSGRGVKLWQISQSVLYSGYLIQPTDTERLLTAANLPLKGTPDGEIRTLANCILITPRPMPPNLIDRTGPIGKTVRWRINGVGILDNKVWAARVEPVLKSERVYTENRPACVVLALGRNARAQDASRIQQWQDLTPEQGFEFDTSVGEKALLRLNETIATSGNSAANVSSNAARRGANAYADDFPALGSSGPRPRGVDLRARGSNNQRGGQPYTSRSRANPSQSFRGAGRGRGQTQRAVPYNKPGSGRGGPRDRGGLGMDGANDGGGRGLTY